MRSNDWNGTRAYTCDNFGMSGTVRRDFARAARRLCLTKREFLAAALGLVGVCPGLTGQQTKSHGGPDEDASHSGTTRLQVGASTIEVIFGTGAFDVSRESLIAWISKAAKAVAQYYGAFPVSLTRLRVNSSERRSGVFGGETWGSDPPFTRISVGRNTTDRQLQDDWMMTHELGSKPPQLA